MWFDNAAGRPLGVKVIQAVAAYVDRYGVMPEVAFLNLVDCQGAELGELPVRVKPVRYVLPNHVWVGMEVV